ncbi:MAG: D-alanyl-D-alanine carboxypeptidase family protein [Bacillota bacterium]|nr:D-alanyl-D-alanine carboxypeptidase family protein [Thermoanaerobacteraceae bacterium]
MRFLVLALGLFLFTMAAFAGKASAKVAEPVVVARTAVLMDLKTGQVLYAKEPEERMYPASTTKILTALVVLQNVRLDDCVTASKEAVNTGGSAIWVREGEKLAVSDALYALLLNSANDVALALAEKVSGSEKEFVALMNSTARACGATDSHFTNAHGLPDENHYTTALDLARITRVAMGNRVFREIVATRTKNITRPSPEDLNLLINHNKLLWNYEGAIGVKTGYTTQAGQCLVAAARRGERELVAVVLGSEGRNVWTDAASLLDYGFSAYRLMPLLRAGEVVGELEVFRGVKPLTLEAAQSVWYNLPVTDDALNLPFWKLLLRPVEAPVRKGQSVGEIIFQDGRGEIGRFSVIAGNDVARTPWWPVVLRGILYAGGALFGLFILLVVAGRRSRRRRTMFSRRSNPYKF